MIKEGKFGVQEAICLVVIVNTTKVFFTSPAVLVRSVGTTGWYMTLVSAATAMIGFSFVCRLLERFPGKNIVEIFEISLGRYIGFIFSMLLAVLFAFNAASMLREFIEVLKVYVLPMTPPSFIVGIFVAGTLIVSILGLESLVRFSKLFAYMLLISFIAVLVLSWRNFEFHRMFPIFGYGVQKTIAIGASRSSVYGDVVILAVIAGSLQGVKHIRKAGYIGIAISGLLISAALLAHILTFPYYVAMEATSPMYEMTELINWGRFFQRLDPLFLFVWNIGTLISITAMFYVAVSIYCKAFRIQDMKPLLLPSSITLFAGAMLAPDLTSVVLQYVNTSRQYGWIIFFVLPIISLIIASIRKLGTKKVLKKT